MDAMAWELLGSILLVVRDRNTVTADSVLQKGGGGGGIH